MSLLFSKVFAFHVLILLLGLPILSTFLLDPMTFDLSTLISYHSPLTFEQFSLLAPRISYLILWTVSRRSCLAETRRWSMSPSQYCPYLDGCFMLSSQKLTLGHEHGMEGGTILLAFSLGLIRAPHWHLWVEGSHVINNERRSPFRIAVIMAERVPDKLGRWVLPCVPSSIPRYVKFDLTGKRIIIPPFPACALRSSLMQSGQPESLEASHYGWRDGCGSVVSNDVTGIENAIRAA